MSKRYTVHCRECPTVRVVEIAHPTTSGEPGSLANWVASITVEARELAKEGWHQDEGEAVCPKCSEAR